MKIHKTLSESAFLVNESRSRRVDISHDIYAHLWVSDSTKKLWDDFSENVYKFDEIELGLRNRFFLDLINRFIESSKNPIFINIGSGFTSYPFLVNHPCKCVEIDFDHIIDFKQKKINEWIKDKKLPDRKIEFFPADLRSKADLKNIKNFLNLYIGNNPSLIILEGLTYYLDISILDKLLKIFSEIQKLGSILAFDFWDPRIEKNPVYKRFINYFYDRFGHKITCYNLFNIDFIKDIAGYKIIETTDIQNLENLYLTSNILENYNDILPENYVVLKKI